MHGRQPPVMTIRTMVDGLRVNILCFVESITAFNFAEFVGSLTILLMACGIMPCDCLGCEINCGCSWSTRAKRHLIGGRLRSFSYTNSLLCSSACRVLHLVRCCSSASNSRRHLSRSAVAIVPPTDLWGCLQLSGTDGKDIMAHLMRKFSGFKRERSRVLKEG